MPIHSRIAVCLLLLIMLPVHATALETAKKSAPLITPLDANRASAYELQMLKGIGPHKAAAIVEERNQHGAFIDAQDLTRVKGIGKQLATRLEEQLSFHKP